MCFSCINWANHMMILNHLCIAAFHCIANTSWHHYVLLFLNIMLDSVSWYFIWRLFLLLAVPLIHKWNPYSFLIVSGLGIKIPLISLLKWAVKFHTLPMYNTCTACIIKPLVFPKILLKPFCGPWAFWEESFDYYSKLFLALWCI